MTNPTSCDPVSATVQVATAVPAVGALICAVAIGGAAYKMSGPADSMGGCGEPGGELMRVLETHPDEGLVCATPEAPPVTKFD